MATDGHVNTLQQALDTLLKYTDTELINRTDWGSINFEEARPDVEAALIHGPRPERSAAPGTL